jgi:hypothetical protein
MSLPPCFGNFKINYISSDMKCIMAELIANLSQEAERLKTENGGHIVNFAKVSSSGHGKSGGKFSRQKGKEKNPYDPQTKLLRKMPLMTRKVSGAFIVRNMSTKGGNVMNLRHDSSRRVMTLFPLLMSPSLLIFSL